MTEDLFPRFTATHGPGTHCRSVPEETIAGEHDFLPAKLLAMWSRFGWCWYGDGLIRLVDPRELHDILPAFVSAVPHRYTVFARTAFGDFLYFDGEAHRYVNVHARRYPVNLRSSPSTTFETFFCDRQNISGLFHKAIYQKAKKRLGSPDNDEMFTFVPALAAGGDGSVESIQRVKMLPQLAILAQF